MKRFLTLSFVVCALTLSAGAKTIKTVVFTTEPQMHCDKCENRIKGNLRFIKGVKQIETNVKRQTVVVEYDADKTSPEEIEKGFRKIGYEVKQVTPTKQP